MNQSNNTILTEHPLEFFINLIEKKGLSDYIKQFSDVSFNPNQIEPDFDDVTGQAFATRVISINFEATSEVRTAVIQRTDTREEYKIVRNFNQELIAKLDLAKHFFLTNFDLTIINKTNKDQQTTYIDSIINYLHFLITKLDQYKDADKYPFIKVHLLEMLSDINAKYKTNHTNKATALPTVEKSKLVKLQWRGPVNMLATLFFDLNREHIYNGEPILKATPQQLEDFLINNFVDIDGNPLSLSSISTYLNPSRKEKRTPIGKKIDTSKYTSDIDAKPASTKKKL